MKKQLVSAPKEQNVSIRNELIETFTKVLDSGQYILGPAVQEFEEAFARFCQTKYCVGVGNGTDALTLALMAAGVQEEDEVLVPSFTATFTILAISATGAKPVFVEIDPLTYTVDPKDLKKKISKKSRAIIPVHLYGHPADMDPVMDCAKKSGLIVIEDACQAHGALYKGKKVGSIGDMGCFSFYPTKNLGAIGDGGAITTNNEKFANLLKQLRQGGQKDRYKHEVLGKNSRLDELQAAILSVKLKYLSKWNEKRRLIAKTYSNLLKDSNLILPKEAPWAKAVFHLYVVRTKDRTRLMQLLNEAGIQTQIHYPIPAHLQPIYKTSFTLPTTERIANEVLSLPIYPELSLQRVHSISKKILEILGRF